MFIVIKHRSSATILTIGDVNSVDGVFLIGNFDILLLFDFVKDSL